VLNGGGGMDAILGGNGNDTINGGSDDDILDGEDGNDTIFGGKGDDTVDGGLNSDTIFGGSGDDTINGGNGSDTISGGKGDDMLTGGGGSDVFVLSRHDGNDVITDFQDGSDILDFTVFGLGSKAAVQAAATEIDAGLLFDLSDYGGSGTLLIENMTTADFTGADFIY
jgi:Ca2+-binding RTX toxin-like protein